MVCRAKYRVLSKGYDNLQSHLLPELAVAGYHEALRVLAEAYQHLVNEGCMEVTTQLLEASQEALQKWKWEREKGDDPSLWPIRSNLHDSMMAARQDLIIPFYLKSAVDSSCISALTVKIMGNFKSMVKQNLQEFLRRGIAAEFDCWKVPGPAGRSVARMIVEELFRPIKEDQAPQQVASTDGDEEEEAEEEMAEDVEEMAETPAEDADETPFRKKVLGLVKNHGRMDDGARGFLTDTVADMTRDQLFTWFVPAELEDIIAADKVTSCQMWDSVFSNVGRVLAFLRRVNVGKRTRLLFPGPSTKVGQMTLSPTMHARALGGFLHGFDGNGIITAALKEQEQKVLHILREQFDIRCVSEVNWSNNAVMARHPLVMLPCVFPGILNFLATGKLGPRKDWGLPSKAKVSQKMEILREQRVARMAAQVPPALVQVLPRRFGQEEDWHHLWLGSFTTDGQNLNILLCDSVRPTMRKSALANRLGLDPRPYTYDNILSVSVDGLIQGTHLPLARGGRSVES